MFTLTAFNPNGLNFDTVAHDVESVKNLAKRIMSLGGVDLKLNGKPIPASLLATL